MCKIERLFQKNFIFQWDIQYNTLYFKRNWELQYGMYWRELTFQLSKWWCSSSFIIVHLGLHRENSYFIVLFIYHANIEPYRLDCTLRHGGHIAWCQITKHASLISIVCTTNTPPPLRLCILNLQGMIASRLDEAF